MTSTALDSIENLASTNLSPLRRKSECPQGLITSVLLENNDEIERLERRHEIKRKSLAPKDPTGNARRASLGLGFLAQIPVPQMKERITQCIQLNAENKISIKNAFSLELIDFMTYMIKKQDSNSLSLQVASTTLDVSSKIYGFRVDRIYNEILKLNSGTEKQHDDDSNGENEAFGEQDNREDSNHKQGKKRKRKNRLKILTTHNALKGKIESSKPSVLLMTQEARTTDLLTQAMMPNHAASGYSLHIHNDVILDSVDNAEISEKENGCPIPKIEDFSHLDICPPLSVFEFHNSSEDADDNNTEVNNADEQFQFDLDAQIPPDDEPPAFNMNYLDVDTEDESSEVLQKQTQEVRNIVDLRDIVTATSSCKKSEYTFIQKGLNIHWAGPSHWRARNLKVLQNSNIVETCQQKPIRKRKNIEMSYTSEKKEEIKTKFVEGQAVQLQFKTAKSNWTEETTLLPRDMHYDIMSANKLYLHRELIVHIQSDDLNTTHLSDGIAGYDYNNENDASNYCPNIVGEDYGSSDEPNDEQDIRLALTGQNLVAAPKLAKKIAVTYSTQPKRIDMHQLKKSIWKNLVSHNDKENIDIPESVSELQCNEIKEPKRFSEVSKALPFTLTKANADALSFPISFVSLLHLANEKSLKINTLPDMSDIIVSGD